MGFFYERPPSVKISVALFPTNKFVQYSHNAISHGAFQITNLLLDKAQYIVGTIKKYIFLYKYFSLTLAHCIVILNFKYLSLTHGKVYRLCFKLCSTICLYYKSFLPLNNYYLYVKFSSTII